MNLPAPAPAAADSAESLRVMIVDDEPLARLRLRQLLADVTAPRLEVVAEAGNAAQAMTWLRDHGCDLLLLDVQMPGADGTRFAEELRAMPLAAAAPLVVFVTAHAEHALKAFELEAVDYLTKPVRRERLQAAMVRAAARRAAPGAVPVLPAVPGEAPVIIVNERGRVLRIPITDVLYLKAELKYVTLRTAQHSHVLDEPLAELEQRLGDRFLRIHRNALVARSAIRALEKRSLPGSSEDEASEGWAVRLDGLDEWLTVSRRQATAVREALLAAER